MLASLSSRHHNHTTRNSAIERVHARTERQTKQKWIRGAKRFEDSRETDLQGKSTSLVGFGDTINLDPVYSISDGALGVILVLEICWYGVLMSGS